MYSYVISLLEIRQDGQPVPSRGWIHETAQEKKRELKKKTHKKDSVNNEPSDTRGLHCKEQ